MTTYNSVFGNETIPPSDSSFSAVTLTADTQFSWPELSSGSNLLYDILDVTLTGAWSIILPAASAVSNGRSVVFNNLSVPVLTIKDVGGNILGTINGGKVKCLYLTDNSTANGVWELIEFAAGTTVVDAAAIVGYGLVVTGATLSQNYPVTASAASASVLLADRAKTFVFTGSGAVNLNLLTALSAGNGFFINVSNQGTGSVTMVPDSTVDGLTTKELAPGESTTLVCDGAKWVTIGFGRSTQFQFTKLVLDISTGSPFTLDSVQAQNKLVQFIGIATANVTVNVPAVVAVYYLECSYTGAFTLTIKTASGTGVTLSNTDRSIVYCDGTNVVSAQTSSVPATNLAGGVAGALVYQSSPSNTTFSAAGTIGQLLASGGPGAPTWTSAPALGTPLSGTLTNCTGLPPAGVSGTALVAAAIGATVQAYDANTVKKNTAQTFTAAQRGTVTTDNDGSFDQSVTNNFFCTPTGAVALTFTNHTAGQSGLILFVNSSNYAITAAATTYIAAADLTKLSATGTYLISYLDNGTNAYCVVSAKLTSAGA